MRCANLKSRVGRWRRAPAFRRTSGRQPGSLAERLESRSLMAADLTASLLSASLAEPVLEGSSGSAQVRAINRGDQDSGRLDLGVYLSRDAVLDASDRLIGTTSSGGGVDARKSKDFTVPLSVTGQMDPGEYRLLAQVDRSRSVVESDETNNVAVGGVVTVRWQFGDWSGNDASRSLTLRDADGTLATLAVHGAGWGEVQVQDGAWSLQLWETDSHSVLAITTDAGGDGLLTLESITVDQSLLRVDAPTTRVTGSVEVHNGPLPMVQLESLAGGVALANAPPQAQDDVAVARDGGADVVIDVLANDLDANTGDTKTIVDVDRSLLVGNAEIVSNGQQIVYRVGSAFRSLASGVTATDTFLYTMRDASGATSVARVVVTIHGTNDAPLALADTATVQEHQSIAIPVLANDQDPDAGDLRKLVSIDRVGTIGATSFASSGGVSMVYYTPRFSSLAAGEQTIDEFRYTMADGAGATSTAIVRVTVVGVNDAPAAVEDRIEISEDTVSLAVDVLANDRDSDPGDSRWVTTVDGNGRPSEIVITSHPSQEVTTFIVVPAIPAIQGQVSLASDGTAVAYAPTSRLQYLRSGQTQAETIFYTIRDSAGATSTSTLTVIVAGQNDRPMAVADAATVATNAEPVVVDLLANDLDVDMGDSLSVVELDTSGLRGSVTLADQGKLTYHVGHAFDGLRPGETAQETIRYTVRDAAGATSSSTVTFTIVSGNHAPIALSDRGLAVEDGDAVHLDVLANDQDADGNQGRNILQLRTEGLRGDASIAPDRASVVYAVGQAFQSLRAGETATETFQYTMADALGSQSTADVVMTITGMNDAPSAIADQITVSQDADLTRVDVLMNDRDADVGDELSVVAVEMIDAKGSIALADEGMALSYRPAESYRALANGAQALDRFRYTMQDASGMTSIATLTVQVVGRNDAPLAVPDQMTVSEDASRVTLSVLANDTDVDAGDTKRIVSIDPRGLRGSVVLGPGGASLLYTAGDAFQLLVDGQTAIETFRYTMQDRDGLTSTAEVQLTVTGRNDGPRALADTLTVREDEGVVVIPVLANDTNDMDPRELLRVVAIDGAGRYSSPRMGFFDGAPQFIGLDPGFPGMLGRAVIAEGGRAIRYTPPQSGNAGETIQDAFFYTIQSQSGQTSTSTVTITVTAGANDGPRAVSDTAFVAANVGTLVLDVLANDTDPDTRIDPPRPDFPPSDFDFLIQDATPADMPDTKSLVDVNTERLLGTATIRGDGKLVYETKQAFLDLPWGTTVTETLRYTMQDAAGQRSSASVMITIYGTVGAPEEVPFGRPAPLTSEDDRYQGTQLADYVFAQLGDDIVQSLGGNDSLYGGEGRDRLDGGAGDDLLVGGADRDLLTGGFGADTFRFLLPSDSRGLARDTILDFRASQGDQLDLHMIDAHPATAADDPFTVVSSFTRVAGQLMLVQVLNGYEVRADLNGDAIADLRIDVWTSEKLTAESLMK